MKRAVRLIAALALVCAATAALAKGHDLVGTWSYQTSGDWNKGPCPVGKSGKGKLKIAKKGKGYTLVFVSGRTCRPASMCTFAGKAKGAKVTFTNSAKVDNEGGAVKNSIVLTFDKGKGKGKSDSSYTHPGGMRCTWGSKIALTKDK
jgi:hypothetical protein